MARILIVDDHPESLELVRAILEHAGYHVTEALDGNEAVAVALRCPPDLVLLDLQMPGMDGFATLRAFREEPQLNSIPIVAVTAHAMSGQGQIALQAGFSGHITKPLSLEHFRCQIRKFLGMAPSGCKGCE
jgi:two-component system, cell cycle response regulator DivK